MSLSSSVSGEGAVSSSQTSQKWEFVPAIRKYFEDFRVLRETPREYWGIQIINFLDCLAYFSLLNVITVFLSDELRFSDTNAGYVVTALTSLTTILLFLTGIATDSLGIRKSLFWASLMRTLCTGVAVVVTFLPEFPFRIWVVTAALVLMAPSMAMMQTLFQSANSRYTNQRSRGAGFNLWYLFMNIGAAGAGLLIDIFRLQFGLSTTWVLAVGVMTSLLCLLVLVSMIRTEDQYGEQGTFERVEASEEKKNLKPLTILKSLVETAAFWRFLALVTALLGVRAVFAYAYLIMPKYWIRILGEGAAIGTLNSINPILIVAGLVLFIPFSNRFNIFKMLILGAFVSASSLFILVLPWQVVSGLLGPLAPYLPAAWTADTFVSSYYLLSILSMFVMSIGEVLWSPKLQEYTAAIAPEGQEGTYFGLSMVPWFLAKTGVSLLSGHMLARWVPDGVADGLRRGNLSFSHTPEAMWLILGLFALLGPTTALIFRSWFTKGARWHQN